MLTKIAINLSEKGKQNYITWLHNILKPEYLRDINVPVRLDAWLPKIYCSKYDLDKGYGYVEIGIPYTKTGRPHTRTFFRDELDIEYRDGE